MSLDTSLTDVSARTSSRSLSIADGGCGFGEFGVSWALSVETLALAFAVFVVEECRENLGHSSVVSGWRLVRMQQSLHAAPQSTRFMRWLRDTACIKCPPRFCYESATLHAALYAFLTASKPVAFHLRSTLRLVCFALTASPTTSDSLVSRVAWCLFRTVRVRRVCS